MSRTVIIGGGISGLATAFRLQQSGADIDFTVLESSSRWGGKINSHRENGFLVEGGPDSFLAQKPSTIELCKSLGIQTDIIGCNQSAGPSTYVWSKGRLHPMPEGMMLMAPTMFLPMMKSRLISWAGKLRMGMEVFIPASKATFDESLGAFVRRRFGQELLDKIAGPLMAGIYSADPERLSLRSTFPMFADMERAHGSLILGMLRRKKGLPAQGKPQPMFATLQGGVQQLIDALVAQFSPEQLRLNCRVLSVCTEGAGYGLTLSDGTYLVADNIVCTTPTFVTAALLEEIDPQLASKLREIRYASTATVSLGFKRNDINVPLNGFGFIVPASEGRRINACSWSSSKFDQRAPEDSFLMRVFVGGAMAEPYAERDEESLIELAREELRVIMGISATPELAKAFRWRKASPQYDVGHQARVKEIEQLAEMHPGLHLAGAGFFGAGIPDCVVRGTDTAMKIIKAERNSNRASDATVPSNEETTHAIS